MDSELKTLIAERGILKASLTRLKRFFMESAGVTPIGALQKRLDANVALYDNFNKIQNRIELLVTGTDLEGTHEAFREKFESTYFNLIAEIESHILSSRSSQQQSSASPTVTDNGSNQLNVKLPTIQLPHFDGKYNEWIKFRDTFMSLIHENNALSDLQKYHYLNSALQGSAARVIEALGISEANYRVAWDALTSRFQDSTTLLRHHVHALLDIVPVKKYSAGALRDFLDDAKNHLLALKSLGEPVEKWDKLIVPLLSRKLDVVSTREWEKRVISSEIITFKHFAEFLEERSKYLENTTTPIQVVSERVERRLQPSGSRRHEKVTAHVASTVSQCPACQGSHALYKCDKFKKVDIPGKRDIVYNHHRCYNCLETGHLVQGCTRKGCSICGRRHHTLLHEDRLKSMQTQIVNSQEQPIASTSATCVANLASDSVDHTVLSTAVIHIKDNQGKKRECRVLLDSGSQTNFVTTEFCRKIGMVPTPIKTTVSGLGSTPNLIKGKIELKLFSRCNNLQSTLSCLTIDKITDDMPNLPLNKFKIPVPSNITLADPYFNKCTKIEALIGASLFWKLLCVGQHRAGLNLIWQKTLLGWVLGGRLTWPVENKATLNRCNLVTNTELLGQVERFWKLEETTTQKPDLSNPCERMFAETTRRDTSGRFIVRVPFRDNITELGSSREQAKRRLMSLEKKLNKQSDLHQQYVQFMKEYEALGHMSRISVLRDEDEPSYYLPHHAVTKESSTTTKVRVVFDGSAKSSSGLSLNDTQWVGPTVQRDLFSILVRFRQHRYVLSADIEKMYRQIAIDVKDRKFQRILWRSDQQSPIETFELNTVTYGTASAPFLATRVLKQIGLEYGQTCPVISNVIINDFYVDDLLTGAQTISEIKYIREKISMILAQAGLHLRKWTTNCPAIVADLDAPASKDLSADKVSKTLGVQWSSARDVLRFTVRSTQERRVTKRLILSEIAQLFDPLGLIGPIIIRAKLIMQQLWQIQAGWDEAVTQELHTQWLNYRCDLHKLTELSIPRWVAIENFTRAELHGFSDASERAYGACVYLRTKRASGQWEVKLICAKSRVAPLRATSLPRLELCGALLLAQLMHKVKHALTVPINKIEYWSDSAISIAWIQSPSSRWKTFVANRVAEIQELTNGSNWTHVKSHDNPADLISRGVDSTTLANNDLWWSGPTWLSRDREHWSPSTIESFDIPEERGVKQVCIASVGKTFDIFSRFSSYSRLLRVTAYCLRFVTRLRKHTKNNNADYKDIALTTIEIRRAEETLIKVTQREIFSKELSALQNGQPVSRSSCLLSLTPFLDSLGLIRVGGRLNKAPIEYSKKHPIVLPSKHPIVDLIIKAEHIRLLHAGCESVTASLRDRYWPLSCRRNVRRIIRNCVRCFRFKPQSTQYLMGDLPTTRVTPARPFSTCGIDYAGPFLTKDRTRSKVTTKAYLCIFVCFVTKAVHLELVTDLTTQAFLNCLRRFIARRGRCQCIVSDNGTNFIGAKNELRDLGVLIKGDIYNSKISNFLSSERIEWRLIPPHAPHFGGLWESGVKSAKYHLRRIIGEQRLTFEELYTLLTQVEACLNSRPLSPISSDPSDMNPLTPGHFLIGDALTALPEQDITDVNSHRLGRYQLIQQMFQNFWKRWHREYLHQLQQRTKWRTPASKKLALGTMVLLKEDHLPPLRWSLGRIIQLHQGTDGGLRVVSVKTADGIFKRPVSKLCILPMDEPEIKETMDKGTVKGQQSK